MPGEAQSDYPASDLDLVERLSVIGSMSDDIRDQQWLPLVMALLAVFVNSSRRGKPDTEGETGHPPRTPYLCLLQSDDPDAAENERKARLNYLKARGFA